MSGIAAQTPVKRPLSIDDVLQLEQIDRATLSPDGAWAAVVVRRGARAGEVYGRTAYEIDPTRSDVWLVSTKTGARRALTHGAATAGGTWCATWSPDGKRLALLSTAPEHDEPRGGDNVRLFVWSRASGAVTRVSDDAVMTQTRYGSALDKLDLRGGADRGTIAHVCATGSARDNAPFLWLDDRRLLVATLPEGEVSAAVGQAAIDAVASGGARTSRDDGGARAILRIVDVATRRQTTVATVPAYPFRGSLTASVSPDGKRLAVLATVSALRPQAGRRFPQASDDSWTVERRLGFVDLVPDATLRWAATPAPARYPLELYGWSPDGRSVALRARADPFAEATPLVVADAGSGSVVALGPRSIGSADAGFDFAHPPAAVWIDDRRMITRAVDGGWWLQDIDGKSVAITRPAALPAPDRIARAGDGSLVALASRTLLRLDVNRAALVPLAQLAGEASFVSPQDDGIAAARRVIRLHRGEGPDVLATLDTISGAVGPPLRDPGIELIDADLAHDVVLYSESGPRGIFLRQATFAGGTPRDLLALDNFLDRIDWGETRLIDYRTAAGITLKAAVILPPGFSAGRRYPVLTWVYGGYQVRSLDGDYMTDPLQPGLYNLRLYAAKGYVVLVPSMPLDERGERHDVYAQMPMGVLPAIDRLVALGIADPDRIGVFGQSFGGYSVYALVGQTNRFRAAVAMAGATDLTSFYGEFDPTARGYPGIAHEKNENWSIVRLFGQQQPPWRDAASYVSNSPLGYVDRVDTPLLLIHGAADSRGAPSQAEQFFYSLYAQGKTAELLRYDGESHSLAQSPANIRDIFSKVIDWFDRYLATRPASANARKH